ncbi:dihydrolipoamide acetyltransferase [Nannocystis pusilla]|uniref:dihydrolipoamide acetyltransferase n=1 Tax=Nannocystis pusilla TaxID=889268 RepID=UPI003BF1657C
MVASPSRRLSVAALIFALAGAGMSAHAAPAPKKPKEAAPAAPAAAPASADPAPTQPAAQAPTPSKSEGGLLGEDPAASARTSDLYGDRLDGIEAEVNSLKDKIFRSKARLAVLRDTVMAGVAAGGRVVLAHRNLMGVGFRLVRIVYTLDGAQIFARSDESGGLDAEDEILVFDGTLPPGPHEARVELTYQGQGYGVFTYLRGYTFKSPQTHNFNVTEGGSFKLVSKGYERGNLTTEMKDRPAVEFQVVGQDGAAAAKTRAEPAAKAEPAAAPAK